MRKLHVSRGSRRDRLIGLAAAASLLLPTSVVLGMNLASSAPAGASILPQVAQQPGTVFVPIQPCRVIDTVPGSGFTDDGHTLIPGDETLTTPDLHFMCGGQIPHTSDIDAIVANITAVNPSAPGYLTAYAAGQVPPATSTVNFIAGQTIANEATITTGPDVSGTGYGGEITVVNYQGSTDVIVDLQGYYTHSWLSNGSLSVPGMCENDSHIAGSCGAYYPLTPVRVFDTRTASGYQGQNETLGPQSQLSFFPGDEPFLPGGTIPVDTVAVVLNVTAVNPTQNTYLTVWGTGSPMPATSNLNLPAGSVLPNRVIVPVGSNGQISIFNWSGNTNVVVDLDGYFNENLALFNDSGPDSYCAAPAASTCFGAVYYPLITPQRIADTRAASPYEDHGQTLGTGSIREVTFPADHFGPFNPDLALTDFAPADFVAVDTNLTITDATQPSYLTAYPANTVTSEPNASDLNWVAGSILSNGDLLSTGTGVPGDTVQLFNFSGSVDAVVDLYGYFATSFAPGDPTNVAISGTTCAAGVDTTSVSFTPPVVLPGGGPVTYTVTATDKTDNDGNVTATGSSSPILVSGLDDGELYSFTVTATNVDGTSPASAASTLTTTAACVVPGAPTITNVTSGTGNYPDQFVVTFTPPASDGGCAISSYTVTATDTGTPPVGYTGVTTQTGTTSPITMLNPDTPSGSPSNQIIGGDFYTFTMTATNCVGASAPSPVFGGPGGVQATL